MLGGSGMLGSMVVDFLSRHRDISVTATVRSAALAALCGEKFPGVRWALFDGSAPGAAEQLEVLDGHEWVINAVGITKPLIHDDDADEVERAVWINSVLPYLIARRAGVNGSRVLQITTDCAYSGVKGGYSEEAAHDTLDTYGKTKSLGEVAASHVHNVRCSIIGPEPKDKKFLLEWFLSQPPGARVNGYRNHRWNGLTTLHFAKLCHGIIARNMPMPRLQHVIPTGAVNKCQLLQCFGRSFGREDVSITPKEAPTSVDRTLVTVSPELNRAMWCAAGYGAPPSVPEMVSELADYPYRLAAGLKVSPV